MRKILFRARKVYKDEKAYRRADKVIIDALLEENEKLKKELEGKLNEQ